MSRYLHPHGKTRDESRPRWRLTDPPEGRNRTTHLGDNPYGTPNWHNIEPPASSRRQRSTGVDATVAASPRTPRSFEFDARATARPDGQPGSDHGYPAIGPPNSNPSAPRNHRGDPATGTPSNTRRRPRTVLESFQDSGPRVQTPFYGQGSNGQNSGQAIRGRDHGYINDDEGYDNGSHDRRGQHYGGSQERDTRAEASRKQGKHRASASTTSQSPHSHHSSRSGGHQGNANNEQIFYDRMLTMSLQREQDDYADDRSSHREGRQRTDGPSTSQNPRGHHRDRSALRRLAAYDADRMLAMSLHQEQNQDPSGMDMGETFPDYMGDPRSLASGYQYGEQSASAFVPPGQSGRHRGQEGALGPQPARPERVSLIAQELHGEGSKSITRNMAKCGVCLEDFPLTDLYRPCPGNRCPSYCADCTKDYFQSSMSSMPKKPMVCCKKSVSIGPAAHLFPRGFVAEYRRIQIEFDTEDKLYCSFKQCSAFISPNTIDGQYAACWECGRQTCTLCKGGWHRDKPCRSDPEVEKLKRLGERKGWKPCPKCATLTSKKQGCDHISCTMCGTHWCYRCGSKDCDTQQCRVGRGGDPVMPA